MSAPDHVDVILAAIWAARRDAMVAARTDPGSGPEPRFELRIGADVVELLLASAKLTRYRDVQLRLAQTGRTDLAGALVMPTATVDPRVWELYRDGERVSAGDIAGPGDLLLLP